MAKAKAAVSRKGTAAKPVLGSKKSKPIELYYWPTPNGWKISILLEELKLPYTLKLVNIGKGEQFQPAFLKISPNNRMPAIVDPDGPGGKPISVFESGAIMQYLGRKTGKFYPQDERARVAVDEWLFWQVGGLGPMAGQANHFLTYAKEDLAYPKKRYTDEVHRLFGVMEKRLAGRKYLAGTFSIADMACWGWVTSATRYQPLDEFPHLAAWQARLGARPAVKRGHALGLELRKPMSDGQKKVLFGQRAR
jgi:GSH-dependent disulfide-bond oxidoreductase